MTDTENTIAANVTISRKYYVKEMLRASNRMERASRKRRRRKKIPLAVPQ